MQTPETASKGNLPLVSIIVAAYNAEAFIGETLASLLRQDYPRTEIIVVDDGSSDGTAGIAQAQAPRVRYLHQPNSGVSVARNTGIAASTGDLICFFDADDLMPTDRLSLQIDFLLRHRDVGLTICDYRNFYEQGCEAQTHFQTCSLLQTQLQDRPELVLEDARIAMAREHFGITGTLMLRRELLRHVPGFVARLRGCEDFHFYFRLARHTRVGILNKVGMLRRVHSSNASKNWSLMIPDGIRSYGELRAVETDPHIRRALDKRIAAYLVNLARNEANHGSHTAALWHYARAFLTARDRDVSRQVLHGCARTLAMALRLHKSSEVLARG